MSVLNFVEKTQYGGENPTVKDLRETFEDDEFKHLKRVKGNRTWHDAILEEFGYEEDEDDARE